MEEENRTDRHSPEEIVETYRPREYREVVEVYTRPLPGRKKPALPMRRRGRKGLWIFLGCFVVAAALAGISWTMSRLYSQQSEDYYQQAQPESTGEVTIPSYPTGQGVRLPLDRDHGDPMTVQEIYQQVNPAVVTVMAQLENGTGVSVGTGVIFTADGYLLTNYHVVAGSTDCTVALDTGRKYAANYVAGDEKNDLAILKMDGVNLPAAAFGDSDLLTVGDPVYAIGNPLGVELRGTLTDGIVSAINRDVQVDGRTMTLIQTNAALNSGNSGGPLINQYGQVVGINVIKMSSRYSNVEGLGFAIPSASMERMVNDLLSCGEVLPEPLLGVTVLQNGSLLSDTLWGVEVLEVTPDSAAGRAGIQQGDYLLTAGDIELRDSQDLLRARRQYHLGEEMPVELWRDGEILNVTLELEQGVS
ncbi:trypsin-like peptidase domain-containing protein [Oscillibacter sp.]|uniref:S1C family serine protease n=1 Tax=Oscillibacter sp. TaxID=1945593 RepID=UPI002611E6DB|nr:trypsin-like peptidase domain-containing protein [Oscillibacter sp.]MDD3347452.1 trypsin-like peptidase domain-containing protein [Oscillibacter sp.]